MAGSGIVMTQVQGQTGTPKLMRKTLTARNDSGVRTVVVNRTGLSLTTDEPVGYGGGTGTAPTPLETVVGALCGCSATTFERAAGEAGFDYAGLEFDAAYTVDLRGLLGEAEVRPHFQSVEAEIRVHTAESAERLQAVVDVTEKRCPVRNLLLDAGVALSVTWVPVSD
jgi:uncharacterized OsmC-like protein